MLTGAVPVRRFRRTSHDRIGHSIYLKVRSAQLTSLFGRRVNSITKFTENGLVNFLKLEVGGVADLVQGKFPNRLNPNTVSAIFEAQTKNNGQKNL